MRSVRKQKVWRVRRDLLSRPDEFADALVARVVERRRIEIQATIRQKATALVWRARTWCTGLPSRGRRLVLDARVWRRDRLPWALKDLRAAVLGAFRPAKPKVELRIHPPVVLDSLHARWGRLLRLAESQMKEPESYERIRELLAHAFPESPTRFDLFEDGRRVFMVDVLVSETPREMCGWHRITACVDACGELTSQVAMVDPPRPMIGPPPPWEGELARIASN